MKVSGIVHLVVIDEKCIKGINFGLGMVDERWRKAVH